MHRNSTAQTLVQVRGPTVTYGNLKFNAVIESIAYSLDISGFTIRRGGDTYRVEDLPISKALPEAAINDIIRHTFEIDEDRRTSYHEVDFELPEYDERARINFRAVEHDALPEKLILEVEDDSGDWLPIEDVLFAELLPQSFIRVMETGAMAQVNSHSLDYLPIAAE